MDYFAGLDISMDETHVCVLDREGEVVRESKTIPALAANRPHRIFLDAQASISAPSTEKRSVLSSRFVNADADEPAK